MRSSLERAPMALAGIVRCRTEGASTPSVHSPFPDKEKVTTLTKLAGIGELSATLLVAEVFHRRFQNRRHLASYLGLAPSPYASGETQPDQGINKAGDKPARTLLVEITWAWMRHQPTRELALIAIKGPRNGSSRAEFEYDIPLVDAYKLLTNHCHGKVTEKTRHIVPYCGSTWEIDEYSGRLTGIAIAEVEFP